MERSVEILAAIHFFVIGMSHILRPRAWAEFFIMLRKQGAAGNFFNAFLSLGVGSFIVAFHNVWTGIPAILTVIGWAQVTKSLVYFVAPEVGLRNLARISVENSRLFVIPGFVLVAISGLLAFSLVTRN